MLTETKHQLGMGEPSLHWPSRPNKPYLRPSGDGIGGNFSIDADLLLLPHGGF